ncbi:cyclophilin-like fold protein [Orenia marismortui]|nr:cyclophilin-like fold protein [Orenia marismortui]
MKNTISCKELILFLLIVVQIIFSVGCYNGGFNQKSYAQEENIATAESSEEIIKKSLDNKENQRSLNIRIQADGKTIVFELNDSPAAKSLYNQLPMTSDVENYSDNEKIFYPDKKLAISDTPLAKAKAGTLAYYAPWGDIVIFYGDFGSASGLYELGEVVSGGAKIASLSGMIKIEQY